MLKDFVEFLKFVSRNVSSRSFRLNDVWHGRDGASVRLWILREKLNLTEREFAEKLGLKEEEYKRYERLDVEVPDWLINRVKEVFNVDEEWLRGLKW